MNDLDLMTIKQEFQINCVTTKYNIKQSYFYNLQWSENKWIYLIYRSFMMIYSLCWFLVDIITNKDKLYSFHISNWTEILQCTYFCYSFLTVLSSISTTNKSSEIESDCDKDNSITLTNQIRWILLNISATSSIVICILYWIGQASDLINKQYVLLSVTVHVHLICCVMSIIEIFIVKIPIRILHFYQPVLFSIVYITVTLAISKSYPPVYKVLDWVNDLNTSVICSLCGTFLVVPLVHCCFVYPLYRFRVLLANKITQENNEVLNIRQKLSVTKSFQKVCTIA